MASTLKSQSQLKEEIQFDLFGQSLILHAEKVLFWKNERILVLSDLHLGKAGHFRKAGIPIPNTVQAHELYVLSKIIEHYKPREVLFLGDLFHSSWNLEWIQFSIWLQQFNEINFILIRGNHDILDASQYSKNNFLVTDYLENGPFSFSHEKVDSEKYNFSGHVHPAVRLSGFPRPSLKLPCFYFNKTYALMPAFGKLTGTMAIKVFKTDTVYAISDGFLYKVS
jgi:DNA ligase-associated metallophosphoesterase